MVRSFWPSRQRALTLLSFALLAGLSIGGFFAYSAWAYADQKVMPGYALAALAALALAAVASLLFLRLVNTRYEVLEGGLILRLGTKAILLPHAQIDWLRPLSDFKDDLPLPAGRIPGYVFGSMLIKGLGLTRFAATEKKDFVLIASGEQCYVISPSEKQAFVQAYRRNAERYPLHELYDPAIKARETWEMIFSQPTARNMILGGLAAVVLLWVLAALIVSRQAEVAWVNLEAVPAVQLYLLAILGTLIWVFDLFAGYAIYRDPALPHVAAHWLWGMGVFAPIILAVATLMMSL